MSVHAPCTFRPRSPLLVLPRFRPRLFLSKRTLPGLQNLKKVPSMSHFSDEVVLPSCFTPSSDKVSPSSAVTFSHPLPVAAGLARVVSLTVAVRFGCRIPCSVLTLVLQPRGGSRMCGRRCIRRNSSVGWLGDSVSPCVLLGGCHLVFLESLTPFADVSVSRPDNNRFYGFTNTPLGIDGSVAVGRPMSNTFRRLFAQCKHEGDQPSAVERVKGGRKPISGFGGGRSLLLIVPGTGVVSTLARPISHWP
ncbi:hypothetical protein VFPBJ_11764 [Purpureocillium lilacinum]|uniref:Uncharacterized protein n=1 Tax=Purpureocillium lilacinum TaxID=33203 RepID=A0A179EWC0_PURLI|nr:hypothetical protein VFPBJ_11764 [Purpureocillium lilacinum]